MHHTHMALLMTEEARILRQFLPVILAGFMCLGVLTNWQITAMHKSPHLTCTPCRYFLLSFSSLCSVTTCFVILRMGEVLRYESERLLKDIELRVMKQASSLVALWRPRSSPCPGAAIIAARRIARRLPLRLQLYHFFWVKNGLAVGFTQQSIENTVNLVVMARTHNVSKWLL